MKTRTRELAKVGVYGTPDNPKVVTESMLREIAETFSDIGKAPISLNGHKPDPSKPRLGNIVGVSYDPEKKILYGKAEEHDALAQAVDSGFFPDQSIRAVRRASDGKMYLHHSAYLGEEPPAIKDLVSGVAQSLDIAAGDEPAGVIELPGCNAQSLLLSDEPNLNIESNQEKGVTMTEEEAAKLKAAEDGLTSKTKEAEGLAERITQLETKLKEFQAKYPDSGISLSDDDDPRILELTRRLRNDQVSQVVKSAEGRVPRAKLPLVKALAENQTLTESIALSDGEKTEKVSGIDLLKKVLESVPGPVAPGKLDLSDAGEEESLIDMSKLMTKI